MDLMEIIEENIQDEIDAGQHDAIWQELSESESAIDDSFYGIKVMDASEQEAAQELRKEAHRLETLDYLYGQAEPDEDEIDPFDFMDALKVDPQPLSQVA